MKQLCVRQTGNVPPDRPDPSGPARLLIYSHKSVVVVFIGAVGNHSTPSDAKYSRMHARVTTGPDE